MMSLVYGIRNVLCFLSITIFACKPGPGTKLETFTLEKTLQQASIVVSGTDVYHDSKYDFSWNVTFAVSCVFKSNNLEIPRTIFLLSVGATSCDGTSVEEGHSYIVGLKLATEDDIAIYANKDEYFLKGSDIPYYYVMDEPQITTTAAFEVTDTNLNKTATLCGIDDSIVSLGEGEAGDHECPSREVTDEKCVTASGASRLMSAQTSLIPYNSRILGLLLSLAVCALLSLLLII